MSIRVQHLSKVEEYISYDIKQRAEQTYKHIKMKRQQWDFENETH